MVAKITIPESLCATLNYNEKKVQRKVAACIGAPNFLLDHDKMTFYHKLETFEQRNSLNTRAETKTIHISLNFDPSEKFTNDSLNNIAAAYMEKMGFGDQPYLVYRHDDAGHPHIHIVSTLIREDGSRINTHDIGKKVSEPARKAIEEQFGLIKAEQQKRLTQRLLKPIDISKIAYGKTETKESIAEVLRQVVKFYNYTSLPELNAVLRQYHVMADRGEPGGFIHKHNGLLYSLVDEEGRKIGVPIKASRFSGKYTLKHLEENFTANKVLREPFKKIFRTKIDQAFIKSPRTLSELVSALQQQQVYTLLRRGEQGNVYGISFVDNENRCVMNGSEVGKAYSIATLQKRLTTVVPFNQSNSFAQDHPIEQHHQPQLSAADLLEQLLHVQLQNEQAPYSFRIKKRRKKKR